MWFDGTNYWVKMVLTLAIFRGWLLSKVFENRQKKSLKVVEFFWSWRLRTLLKHCTVTTSPLQLVWQYLRTEWLPIGSWLTIWRQTIGLALGVTSRAMLKSFFWLAKQIATINYHRCYNNFYYFIINLHHITLFKLSITSLSLKCYIDLLTVSLLIDLVTDFTDNIMQQNDFTNNRSRT